MKRDEISEEDRPLSEQFRLVALAWCDAKHEPYSDGHLGEVTNLMQWRQAILSSGAPTIRVVRFKGELYATEGSHRLAAAAYLGIIPKIWIDESEVDALPEGHWQKVSDTLPSYEFPHVMALEEKSFK